MRVTASYSNEGLVAATISLSAADSGRVSAKGVERLGCVILYLPTSFTSKGIINQNQSYNSYSNLETGLNRSCHRFLTVKK